ncbi:hypothetical protein NEOLI_000321 [Neolecta irregularis DAH-3]|uniref:DUF2415 domain-containing protein n=1 Tax=Neolecta irregularis (strain DAH-3) TaxID=1198029 RepID=A0A1U7LUQ2_NEOID|nr:hypothetical protein NEOLI_000321 [Neolecta irregularis DAH-3]|eukprot:OLL26272.1 hypothetical protein NEOLI_000321 [Neolecta irregularis DAH-3]
MTISDDDESVRLYEPHLANPASKEYSNVKITIQHWQLRDLVSCPDTSSQVYFVSDHVLRCLDTKTQKVTRAAHEFPFAPRSVRINHGLICVGGGEDGQLCVNKLHDDLKRPPLFMELGGSINNSIFIWDRPCGTPGLLVSNNDKSIKLVDAHRWNMYGELKFPTQINHSSVSTDGKMLVSVGDTSEVFLHNIDSSGAFHKGPVLQGTGEAAFATSFSPSSSEFAVASQDGVVAIYDTRNLGREMANIYSTRPTRRSGAIRTLRYAPAPLDLLLFTEANGFAHLVCTRNREKHQILRVPTAMPYRMRDIAGACFSPDGHKVFVGTETGLVEWNIDTKARQCFPSRAPR